MNNNLDKIEEGAMASFFKTSVSVPSSKAKITSGSEWKSYGDHHNTIFQDPDNNDSQTRHKINNLLAVPLVAAWCPGIARSKVKVTQVILIMFTIKPHIYLMTHFV